MKWFFRWLSSKIDDSKYEEDEPAVNKVRTTAGNAGKAIRLSGPRDHDDFSTNPIQFKMYKASGGWAIEFRQYISKNDRVDTSLYVVNDEEELGKHISQIITMEALKR